MKVVLSSARYYCIGGQGHNEGKIKGAQASLYINLLHPEFPLNLPVLQSAYHAVALDSQQDH